MSADNNVTPIRAGGKGSSSTTDTPPPSEPEQQKVGLSFGNPPDGPSALRLFQALRGVCTALEAEALNVDCEDACLRLATAAEILGEMLEERMIQ